MKRKIKKWLFLSIIFITIIVLIASMVIEGILEAYNTISDLDLFSGIFKEEQQQIDIAHKAHYERVADIASYGMFSNAGDRNQSLFSKNINIISWKIIGKNVE